MSTTKTKPITWPEALDLYTTFLQAKRAAKRTIESQLYALHGIVRFAEGRLPCALALQDLREYQVGLLTGHLSSSKKPLSAGAVANATATLRAFFDFLAEEKKLKENPAARLEPPKIPPRLPGDALSVDEVRFLLGATDHTTALGLRDRAVLEILYATGVRRNELLALDLADLDHNERELTVAHGKGDKPRLLPLTRSAYGALMDYLDRGRPTLTTRHEDSASAVFLSGRGRRLDQMTIVRILRALKAKTGITKNVTPHTFRRTFATHLMKGGVSLRHIQTLLGHERLNTTAVYLSLDAQELRREVILHHPRERFSV